MSQRSLSLLFLLLASIGCDSNRPPADHTFQTVAPDTAHHLAAAHDFTDRVAHSRLAAWKIHAGAAGNDCAVLTVDVSIILDESMVEAMHYGAGAYAVYGGGVERFVRDRDFRGVAYKDASGRQWAYGLSEDEAHALQPCH
jgi:hypothetical protein